MCLATADREGRPSARMVLLKGLDRGGFVFFTNYQSAKGQDLAINSNAALLFFWKELERQIRIEGTAKKSPVIGLQVGSNDGYNVPLDADKVSVRIVWQDPKDQGRRHQYHRPQYPRCPDHEHRRRGSTDRRRPRPPRRILPGNFRTDPPRPRTGGRVLSRELPSPTRGRRPLPPVFGNLNLSRPAVTNGLKPPAVTTDKTDSRTHPRPDFARRIARIAWESPCPPVCKIFVTSAWSPPWSP